MLKKKIIGLFVCILLLSSMVLPVTAILKSQELSKTSYTSDVPIWHVGDEWTYNFIESAIDFPVTYSLFGDLTFKVVEDLGNSYLLEATTRPDGQFDLGNFGLKTTILTTFSMSLQIRKTDLALEYYREIIKGVFLVTIGKITLPIPLQIIGNSDIEFDVPWVIMPFPLYDGKSGNLSATEFVFTNYYMKLFWGLIPVLGPLNITWPITPVPYNCSAEKITVEAGAFDVFNISANGIGDSKFVSYYANEIGNTAKEVIYIPHGGGGLRYSLKLELKDWSYTP